MAVPTIHPHKSTICTFPYLRASIRTVWWTRYRLYESCYTRLAAGFRGPSVATLYLTTCVKQSSCCITPSARANVARSSSPPHSTNESHGTDKPRNNNLRLPTKLLRSWQPLSNRWFVQCIRADVAVTLLLLDYHCLGYLQICVTALNLEKTFVLVILEHRHGLGVAMDGGIVDAV